MNNYYLCADCSAPDPAWASINRGVFLCNQCCSVHRVLGSHISHVRSLTSTTWPPVLKEMVYTLVNKGANSLWEHQILDSHSKTKVRKPTPKDKIHPTKHDFIVCKYKNLAFLPKISNKDNFNSIEDMSRQLHASVRTGNLETCLRLLALGADPNYMHSDRGNTPLHVAAQAGQAMQVELLVVNGADPCRLDRLGHTPEECARIAGHHQLAARLIECQYALTDKLSNFVSGRKPQHNIGEHFLAPQVGHSVSPGMADARSRLQEISNDLFEELATDVYDEVDRRETDAVWLATQQLQSSIAFLPVNPTLSPLRNQGRQKLATLNAEEFAQLVIDILLDTKRRQAISMETGETSGTVVPMTSEDKIFDPHDYDEVAMDENRTSMLLPPPDRPVSMVKSRSPLPPLPSVPKMDSVAEPSDGMYSVVDEKEEDGLIDDYSELRETSPQRSIVGEGQVGGTTVTKAKFDNVMEALKKIQTENERLRQTNQQLQERIDGLQAHLNRVVEENIRLKVGPPKTPTTPTSPLPVIKEPVDRKGATENNEVMAEMYAQVDYSKKKSRSSMVASLPSSRSSSVDQQPASHASSPPLPPAEDLYTLPVKKSARNSSMVTPPLTVTPPPPRQDTPLSDSPFEELGGASSLAPSVPPRSPINPPPSHTPTTTPSTGSSPRTTNSPPNPAPPPAGGPAPFLQAPPTLEEVQGYIKKITLPIQQLLQDAQAHKEASFSLYSIKIASTVDTLIAIFPPGCSQQVSTALREVKHSAYKLKSETCDVTVGHADVAYRTRLIINSAYDVAKACRHLVTYVEQETTVH